MSKRLIFNGFSMNVVSHIFHGMWRHPESRQSEFNDLDFWIGLVKLFERGRFDNLFIADVLGVDPAYKGSWDTYVTEAVQIPVNDSSTLVGALIHATERIGLTFTSSILQDHPFSFARRVSTLDHLSKGRIGWNIVTSVSHNAAQNFGFDRIVPHDERYRWAEDYVDVVYKLWEGSWDEDAVRVDRRANVYADPDRIHRIHHRSERYKVLGPHLTQPSAQRTPVLFQAGSSRAGRAFAARHAEGTFIVSLSPEGARKLVEEVDAKVEAAGRRKGDLLYIQGLSFVVGSSEAEARTKARDLDDYMSLDGALAHISRDLGIDLGLLDPDRPVEELEIEGIQGYMRYYEEAHPERKARVRDLGQALALNTRIVGTPESIADQLQVWRDAGIDGVNVIFQTAPGSFADFIEHVTPLLQKRGLAQTDYAPGSLRERLFPGRGARLGATHPAARYRGAFGARADHALEADATT
ncbi:NtaA/DmoA family FMN-dependent monooxygenase [Labrys wisconsinensis]|uniref:FMN-dependent oxidoreductase (Nitrilotriacetate monooxygenase family) n=1 Tax=Labrys wisconsinensis TaxID=425677 RepID=A0ABU0JLX3_9HYPH|nr:NtaA/DmoA family FMN-dependent monooxygenase [Labrys wisconsinensis]MDQ0475297.1 FMN-dependent oxidoreductase (nitrilotriacetate monooxygenase family) [Labrys wisconsinensis]